MMTPLDQPLATLAAALAVGRLTAREVIAAAVDRHRARAALGAYLAFDAERALGRATTADRIWAEEGTLGPLHGLPVAVKDHFATPGFTTYAGTSHPLPTPWQQPGPLIRAVGRQWGIVMGKTVAVELAFGGLGVNRHWGTPYNPWDARHHRVPGGSSSGAGVSLWEGSALVALGTDTGGSVRVPATMTGTVGLKTSAGRWSTEGVVPLSPTLDTVGVLTRTVADAAYAFAALEGIALEDIAPKAPHELRLGVLRGLVWDDCSPGVGEIVTQALGELTRAGVAVADHPLAEAGEAVLMLRTGSVVSAECDAFLHGELAPWLSRLDPIVTARIADGGSIPAREYLLRRRRLAHLAAAAQGRFQGVDALVWPTVPITPPRTAEVERLEDYRRLNMLSLRNTCIANMLDLCALTLPVGLDAAGMPVGLQLVAPAMAEAQLLGAGLAVEAILGTAPQRLGSPPAWRCCESTPPHRLAGPVDLGGGGDGRALRGPPPPRRPAVAPEALLPRGPGLLSSLCASSPRGHRGGR